MGKRSSPLENYDDSARATGGPNPITGPVGATIQPQYMVRYPETIAVNKSDLEDLKEFDESAVRFAGLGTFLASGAVWLMVEKALENWSAFKWSPLFWLCLLCVIVGAFLVYQGRAMHLRKASRIDRIFSESRPLTNAGGAYQADGYSSASDTTKGELK